MDAGLLELEDRGRVEMVLKYIEDGDLRRWSLPDIRAFNIGLGEWRSKLNCFTNPYMYEQVWNVMKLGLLFHLNTNTHMDPLKYASLACGFSVQF